MKRLSVVLLSTALAFAPVAAIAQGFTGPAMITQPTTKGNCVKINSTRGQNYLSDAGATCGTASSLTVGTTNITGGSNGNIEYNNSGKLGELATTGSGNVVRATSPTLVTPVLGTPASGNPVNLTTGQPYFFATLTSAQTGLSSAAYTKVSLNSITLDSGSYWSSSNHNYVPLIAGTYLVCGSVHATAGTAITGNIVAAIDKNGLHGGGGTDIVLMAQAAYVAGNTITSAGATDPCGLVAMNGSTDTLELDGSIVGTGALQFDTFSTYLTISRIGP